MNLASVLGLQGDPNVVAYVASKHAVIGITRSAASAEIVKKAITDRIPLGRYAEPDEVAALIAFLASDDAKFINGSLYTIHGGWNQH